MVSGVSLIVAQYFGAVTIGAVLNIGGRKIEGQTLITFA
jgi:hypothetical protein